MSAVLDVAGESFETDKTEFDAEFEPPEADHEDEYRLDSHEPACLSSGCDP